MADIKMGQLLHRPSNAPIDKTNPLEVKLTGNIVSFIAQENVTIPAGSISSVNVDLGGLCKDLYVYVYCSQPHDVRCRMSINGGAYQTKQIEIASQQPAGLSGHHMPYKVTDTDGLSIYANFYRSIIVNRDTSNDAACSVWVVGTR